MDWRDVDHDPQMAAEYLERVTKLINGIKKASIRMLRIAPGQHILDIGCGLGDDVRTIAARVAPSGSVTGIDKSECFIAKARANLANGDLPVKFQLADASSLPFRDASFDATRVDRVLQHLDDPRRAIAEMVRVTRLGGRIVALEPDWYTVAVSGKEHKITEVMRSFCARTLVRHGTVGRDLCHLLRGSGCSKIRVRTLVFYAADLIIADKVMKLQEGLTRAVNDGVISGRAAERWWSDLQARNRMLEFYASVNCVIASGVVRP